MTAAGSTEGSGSIGWKWPLVKSSRRDTAAFARSSDLGVKTTRGRVSREWTCQRRRWKNEAGVDGIATVMLSWAQSCRKRSTRADE
ncbi:unannotated protein [freshwater metagenome]|uniref:Unannotated protein n=1 Tax=freshwater metagenome TaxID=449393 RepID=A0A6J7MY10_9ZZZZ